MALYSDPSPVREYTLTGDPFIDSLLDPQDYFRNAWSTQVNGVTAVTYSFPWADGVASKFIDNYGTEPGATTTGAVSSIEKPGIALAFQKWAEVANITFTPVAETALGRVGDIRIAFSSAIGDGFWGYTKIVSDGHNNTQGDIWIEPSQKGQDFGVNNFNLSAMMHEIGHALGLDHPFDGNIIPAGYDNRRYTIMSYTDPDGVYYYNAAKGDFDYLIRSPMVYDIAAIQHIYGANMKFHSADDNYTYQANDPFFATIWDAGGKDTIDISGFTKGCSIDLHPGSYSSLDFTGTTLTDNLGIAFNCTIENVNGGQGDDVLVGNEVANVLNGNGGADQILGNGGNDTLSGGTGGDTIDGGTGNDTVLAGRDGGNDTYTGGSGTDTLSYSTAKAAVTVVLGGSGRGSAAGDAAGTGTDSNTGFESLLGSSYGDALTGSAGADRIDGRGGADVLLGLGGDDILTGGAGNDTLDGGADRDTASYSAATVAVTVSLLLAGAAQATGGAGADTLIGIENLTGSKYADTLTGNASANALNGGAGADVLAGLGGADTLSGNAGNDTLIGGSGRDLMIGGTGADRFVFANGDLSGATASTSDRIMDFRHGEGDVIDLSAVDANSANGGSDDAFGFIGTAAFGHHAGELRLQAGSLVSYLQGDTNGDGLADFWIRLDGVAGLATGDLVL